MARTDPVFNLRMPLGMKDEIAEIAKKNGRSMNSEIVQMLEDGINRDKLSRDEIPPTDLADVVKIQEELLLKYKIAIDKGASMLEEIHQAIKNNNKK
ncbi:TPA: Arc family DNA-binding protein [Yersinia enterocolitica]|nr:Arc family DNA-binding protein [Yersinia enterocolitica]